MFKRNWAQIDIHATQASADDAATYDSLMKYFEKIIPNDIDRDINMLRGLTYWMYYNETVHIPAAEKPSDSPRQLLLDLRNDKMSYAVAYETLCKKFGIQCEVVKGISKSGSYRPGDVIPKPDEAENKMGAYWNKVFLEGRWWPVYPRWIMKTSGKESQAADQPEKSTFKEFWFLTDPELFIYKCYPDEIQNQMLPKSKQVKTMKRFFRLPYLTLHFFKANLKLLSEDSCIIDSEDGVGKVHFKADKIPSRKLAFHYNLTVRERNGTTDITNKFDVPKLVLNSRNKGNFIFEVRCPEEADYTLEIKGGQVDSAELKLYVVTKIICREKLKSGQLLPVDAGQIGWGFGPSAFSAGILKSNIHAPKVSMKPGGKKIKFDFVLDENVSRKTKYTAELVKDECKSNGDLKDFVKTDLKKNRMSITAGVPSEGEFALVIKAGEDKDNLRPVCYYLLTTYLDEETVADAYYDSSDGTSDLDEEIEDIRKKIEEVKKKKEGLLKRYGQQIGSQTQ